MAHAIKKADWEAYFDLVSRALETKRAEIEVESLDLGDQVESDWLPLLGISYDPEDDIFDVALEGLDHIIYGPREVHAEGGLTDLNAVEIKDRDGTRHLIRLRDTLALPGPR